MPNQLRRLDDVRGDDVLIERAEVSLKCVPSRGDLQGCGRRIVFERFKGPESCGLCAMVSGRGEVAARDCKRRQIALGEQETVLHFGPFFLLAFWRSAGKNGKIRGNTDHVS